MPNSRDLGGSVKGEVVTRRPVNPEVFTGRLIISSSSAWRTAGMRTAMMIWISRTYRMVSEL